MEVSAREAYNEAHAVMENIINAHRGWGGSCDAMVLGKGAHCLRPPSPSRTRRAWQRDGPSRAGGVYFHSSPTRILSSIAARAAQRERLLLKRRLTGREERPFLAEHLEDESVPSSCKGRNVSSSKDALLEEGGERILLEGGAHALLEGHLAGGEEHPLLAGHHLKDGCAPFSEEGSVPSSEVVWLA